MSNIVKKFMSNNTGIILRFDDISQNMNWELMKKCEELFNRHDIKPLLGVIPNNQDKEFLKYENNTNFWEEIRKWQSKGWEISMHGCRHLYVKETNKKDYFGYGGKSEFYGQEYDVQKKMIEEGLKKFKDEKINIRSFFAPNHTYDLNTFKALTFFGIKNIIDGYGLMPYSEKEINFIPQLFYKEIMLPFGIQATQIHLNYWNNKDFEKFEKFVEKNKEYFITFDDAVKKVNNGMIYKIIRYSMKKTLGLIRSIKN